VKRILTALYGLFAYAVALVGQVWFILYLTRWEALPRTIYDAQTLPTFEAAAVDAALVLLFGLQHSGMARKRFKRFVLRFMPEAAERSTYVLLSGIVFVVICLAWQPVDGTVWNVEDPLWRSLLWAGYVSGWLFSLAATFVIDHFELFGLRQAWLYLKNETMPPVGFQERLFYRFVRHPVQTGVLLALWITPEMTAGHLLLSVLFTVYILVGIYFEEKDLAEAFGTVYKNYRERVGMLFPRRRR